MTITDHSDDIVLVHEDTDEAVPAFEGKNFVYHEIRAKLAQLGIPPHEVAFIQEFNSKAKRAELFAKMNAGEVRVLLCSKQTTGMNVQQRLIALHHLDAPWRPGDVEQREGRIRRQDNCWPEVYVFPYVTEGSFDGYIWQTLETKARFIEQMRAGDVSIREIDDISETVLSASELKALASGNPAIMRKVQLDAERVKLESLYAGFRDAQAGMRQRLHMIEYHRQVAQKERARLVLAQELIHPYTGGEFRAVVTKGLLSNEALAYTKRDAAGQAVRNVAAQYAAYAMETRQHVARSIGTYHGLQLRVVARPYQEQADVYLAVAHDGDVHTLSSLPLVYETDRGVFASADKHIRDITTRIGAIDHSFTEWADEEANLGIALEQPWEYAARYNEVREELEQVNSALLRVDEQKDKMTTADTPASEPAPTATDLLEITTFEVVGVVDDDVEMDATMRARSTDQPFSLREALALLPPTIIPAAANPAAMDLAMAQLAGTDALPTPSVVSPIEDQSSMLVAQPVIDPTPSTKTQSLLVPSDDDAIESRITVVEIPITRRKSKVTVVQYAWF